jgi:hypothetical protein
MADQDVRSGYVDNSVAQRQKNNHKWEFSPTFPPQRLSFPHLSTELSTELSTKNCRKIAGIYGKSGLFSVSSNLPMRKAEFFLQKNAFNPLVKRNTQTHTHDLAQALYFERNHSSTMQRIGEKGSSIWAFLPLLGSVKNALIWLEMLAERIL